jgi:nickel transport protein
MRIVALALAFLLALALPASAHRMKLFATVEDGTVSGYAFFIGGGRPEGATLVIRDRAGLELYRGATGEGGAFSWQPAHPTDLALTVDAGDGHVAEATITEGRFAQVERAATVAAGPATETASSPQMPDPSALTNLIDRSVDRAVSRQIRPLLEAYAAADGRVRFNDVAGGIGMIVGISGLAMWAFSRRRTGNSPSSGGGQS